MNIKEKIEASIEVKKRILNDDAFVENIAKAAEICVKPCATAARFGFAAMAAVPLTLSILRLN